MPPLRPYAVGYKGKGSHGNGSSTQGEDAEDAAIPYVVLTVARPSLRHATALTQYYSLVKL